jgi:heavy metal efflux system protein
MGPNVSDTYVMLEPQSGWKRASTQDELAEEIEKQVSNLPGQSYEFSQPIWVISAQDPPAAQRA